MLWSFSLNIIAQKVLNQTDLILLVAQNGGIGKSRWNVVNILVWMGYDS
jgi:hypothetical protein